MTTITIERETLIDALRKQAEEIAAAGHAGWGNTMLDAAAALAAQPAEPVAAIELLMDSDGECSLQWIGPESQFVPGATFYAAQPAPAAVPLTDEQIDHTLATTLDEFARTTRGMSHALDANADITVNSRLRRMFARAVLAAAGDKP